MRRNSSPDWCCCSGAWRAKNCAARGQARWATRNSCPSAYLKYARSFSGEGAPDIWNSGPDSLASIANFLKDSGWRPGLPALIETRVPQNFDYASLQQDFSAFSQAGFVGVDGAALPKGSAAMLFFPVGASGPAFLLSENFFRAEGL